MKSSRTLSLHVLLVPGLALLAAPAPAAPVTPTLVAIRAAHHPGFDRVVFVFRGGLPASRRGGYVRRLLGDGSGPPIPAARRGVLPVSLSPAQAHDAGGGAPVATRRVFTTPDVVTAVQAGDFEGVTTYGIGLAKRTPFHVSTLRRPARVVVDVRARFATVTRRVYFLNAPHVAADRRPVFSFRLRPGRAAAPAARVL